MIANPSKRLTENRKITNPSECLTVKANWSQYVTGYKKEGYCKIVKSVANCDRFKASSTPRQASRRRQSKVITFKIKKLPISSGIYRQTYRESLYLIIL